MTFDDMLEAFGDSESVPLEAIDAALADWDACAPRFHAMLRSYVDGYDMSERTERALHTIVHLFAEKADSAAFTDLCRMGELSDKLDSVYGNAAYSFGRCLVSTFGSDPAPLFRLVGCGTADDYVRCEALMVAAYLAGEGRIAEDRIYGFLSELPAGLPDHECDMWYGYAKAVAFLGFAGLSGLVDAAFKRDLIATPDFQVGDFWRELRATLAEGRDTSGPDWSTLQPIESAAEQLRILMRRTEADAGWRDTAIDHEVQEPVRNPLRSVGRNDPCPCGSGKKYKKCCLQAAPA